MGTPGTQFGTIFVPTQLQDAVIVTLKKWLPRYLREVEHQLDLKPQTLAVPENFTTRNSFDAQAGEKVPKVVVISPGTIGTAQKSGKQYMAVWSLGIGVAVSAPDEDKADLWSKCYIAACTAIMVQKPALESDIAIADVVWLDSDYSDLPVPSVNSVYKSAGSYFGIAVEDVVSRWQGPDSEIVTDPTDFGIAQTVDVVLEKVAIV